MPDSIQIPAARVEITEPDTKLMSRTWYRFLNAISGLLSVNGSFYDTTTQTAAANTPKAITLNTTSIGQNIALGTTTSQIVVTNAGTYSITFSIQLSNSSTTAADDVVAWLKLDGLDVPYSASWITVPVKHSGKNGSAILTVNLSQPIGTYGYVEVYWMTVNGTTSVQTVAASTSPAYPASPGIIVTLAQIV